MSKHSFHPLEVSHIEKLTSDCVSVRFDIPDHLKKEYTYIPGQHLTLLTTIDNEEVRRAYSLSSAPYENKWEVAIKKVKNGKFSTFANETLAVGDMLQVMTPDGSFRIHENHTYKTIVAFAAGSGITPIISMIKTILKDETQSFILFYGNRNTESIIYREELEALKNRYLDRFSVHYILSKEKLGSPLFFGRIDEEKCRKFAEYFMDIDDVSQFMLCGPGDMIFEIKDTLISLDVDPSKIHFELFTTADIKKPKVEEVEKEVVDGLADVKIRIDGLISSHQIPYNGRSILEHASENGADIPFSCKGGVCSTCKAKLLSGKVSLDVNYALEPEEIEAGFILTCQAHPRSEKLEIDFDEK